MSTHVCEYTCHLKTCVCIRMCVFGCMHTHVCVCVCLGVCIHVFVFVCVHMCVCVYLYTYIFVFVCAHVRVRGNVCMCVYKCAVVCVQTQAVCVCVELCVCVDRTSSCEETSVALDSDECWVHADMLKHTTHHTQLGLARTMHF